MSRELDQQAKIIKGDGSTMDKKMAIQGAKVLTPQGWLEEATVLIRAQD